MTTEATTTVVVRPEIIIKRLQDLSSRERLYYKIRPRRYNDDGDEEEEWPDIHPFDVYYACRYWARSSVNAPAPIQDILPRERCVKDRSATTQRYTRKQFSFRFDSHRGAKNTIPLC